MRYFSSLSTLQKQEVRAAHKKGNLEYYGARTKNWYHKPTCAKLRLRTKYRIKVPDEIDTLPN